jgi:hypothetical protein
VDREAKAEARAAGLDADAATGVADSSKDVPGTLNLSIYLRVSEDKHV